MQRRHLLAVWAHPDDEAFGPVGTMRLAHERGWQTAIITATRGDAGDTRNVQLAAGQTLGDVREAELRAACDVLGVARVDVWRYHDGKLAELPHDRLVAHIVEVMQWWQPRVVITFGPDGITGHPDHIAISTATEQAFHRMRADMPDAAPARLYYVTVRPGRVIEHRMGAAPPPKPPTAVVDVGAYEQIKRAALACHASQQGEWEPMLADRDWLTVDRFFRAFPPVADGAPPELSILDE